MTAAEDPRGPVPEAPTVSVILPVRNRVSLVEAAARTVLDQTWRDLELIVVDGASTDGTVDVLRRLAAADARVRLVLNDLPEGVSAARNQGARLARGKYLAFQDSDDAWHPEILARQMEALGRRPRARLCYAGVRRTLPSGTYLRPPSWNGTVEGDLHRQILRASLITTPALVVERALFDEVGGFDERLRFNEDWDLAVRLTARSEVACAKDWLLESSRQPDSLSADRAAQMASLELLIDKHREFLLPHPRIHEERLATLGLLMLANGRRGGPRLRQALALRPLSLHAPALHAAGRILWGRARLSAQRLRARARRARQD